MDYYIRSKLNKQILQSFTQEKGCYTPFEDRYQYRKLIGDTGIYLFDPPVKDNTLIDDRYCTLFYATFCKTCGNYCHFDRTKCFRKTLKRNKKTIHNQGDEYFDISRPFTNRIVCECKNKKIEHFSDSLNKDKGYYNNNIIDPSYDFECSIDMYSDCDYDYHCEN
jgi:hypothetical protein